jgi:hypothetical protein
MTRIVSQTLATALGVTILAVAVGAGTGAAAPGPIASPAVVQSVLDCRKVADNAERLACFDKATATMEHATASGDLVSIDREQRRAARRQAFGFALPSLSFLDRGEKTEEADNLTAIVAAADEDPFGKWVVRLDGGAVWTQIDVSPLARRPHKGSVVKISKGALGGFFMTIDGEGAGKARRVS